MSDAVAGTAEGAPEINPAVSEGSTTEGTSTGAAAAEKPAANNTADWREGLDGDSLEIAKRFSSPQDLVRNHLELRKQNSQMLRIPGKDAKPEDVLAFRKKIGAGEKVDDYKFQNDEGVELTDLQQRMQAKAAEVLYKHNASPAAAAELQAMMREFSQEAENEQNSVFARAKADAEAALQKKWGSEKDANGALALRAAKTYGLEKFLDAKLATGWSVGTDPQFIEAFARIGRSMGEDGLIGAVGDEERGSVQSLMTQKNQEMHTAYAKGDRVTAARLNQEVAVLSSKLYGNAPVVGRNGRAA